jgi:hypothetical protein
MGVGRVGVRLDVRGVVRQKVVDIMGLRLVGADDAGVEGHVVGDPRVIGDALLQPEILRGMAGAQGVDLGLKLLPVAR